MAGYNDKMPAQCIIVNYNNAQWYINLFKIIAYAVNNDVSTWKQQIA